MESCNSRIVVRETNASLNWNLHIAEVVPTGWSVGGYAVRYVRVIVINSSAKMERRNRTDRIDQERPAPSVRWNRKRLAEAILGYGAAGLETFDADSIVVQVSAIN